LPFYYKDKLVKAVWGNIIPDFYENRKKRAKTLCGHNAEISNVKHVVHT
jgi:hypothetical protein